MSARLGIELLSFAGLPVLEQVALAAQLGCAHISCGLTQMPAQYNPLGFPEWSLRDDAGLRRELRSALRDTGVSISLGEGFSVRPGQSIADKAGDMDLMAELGARGLGATSTEPDGARAEDEFAALARMAAERGMLASIEYGPGLAIEDLAGALRLVARVDVPGFGLLIDAMHHFRSGGTAAQIAALDPALINYAQLCDVPLMPAGPAYFDEAMRGRLAPGEGDLPLADFIAALPPGIPVGLEVPNAERSGSADDIAIWLAHACTCARALFKQGE